MRVFKIKNPFNTLSQQVLKDTLCLHLDRYCMHESEPVAVFHLNDPEGVMAGYTNDDGLVYLNVGTMKLISELAKNSDSSEALSSYLSQVRRDLENRAKLPMPFITCFRSPLPKLMPPIKIMSGRTNSVISDIFKQTDPT